MSEEPEQTCLHCGATIPEDRRGVRRLYERTSTDRAFAVKGVICAECARKRRHLFLDEHELPELLKER